jgi:hypothetical protein
VTAPEWPRAPAAAAVRNVPLLKRGVGEECNERMIPPVELEEDAREDEAAASRLVFFFFLALEGVEAGARPALPPAREEEEFGV